MMPLAKQCAFEEPSVETIGGENVLTWPHVVSLPLLVLISYSHHFLASYPVAEFFLPKHQHYLTVNTAYLELLQHTVLLW